MMVLRALAGNIILTLVYCCAIRFQRPSTVSSRVRPIGAMAVESHLGPLLPVACSCVMTSAGFPWSFHRTPLPAGVVASRDKVYASNRGLVKLICSFVGSTAWNLGVNCSNVLHGFHRRHLSSSGYFKKRRCH